jgi:uncharacterized protein
MASSPSAVTVRPTVTAQPSGQRLGALDILRGLAILGMIVVHFHQRLRLDASGVEDLIPWGVWVLIEQKSWGIFAVLFGAGFALFLRRLETRGDPVVPIYLRRLAALALFGVIAEAVFGFNILFTYACWGLVLLLVRGWPGGALLALALAAVCARPLATWLTGTPVPPPTPALSAAVAAASRAGGFGALVSARWALFHARFPDTWAELLPETNLALFVIGMLALRHGVLDDPGRHRRLIAGWMGFGAIAWAAWWLGLRGVVEESTTGASPATGFGLVQDQWLCFTYIGAVLLLLAARPRLAPRLAPFAYAGRMALTNYIVQVIVIDVLASGYGLGLRLRPVLYLPSAIGLFLALALTSRAWLRRYRLGPLEWAWRVVTDWRMQPIAR